MVYDFKLADHCETCRYYYQHYIRCGNRYESLGKRCMNYGRRLFL